MREHSRDRGRLEDILKYGRNVESIVRGLSFREFAQDIRIYYATMKNLEIIGEAANMLTRHFKETYTELPWRQIVGMRNILVHGYALVSDSDLWETATHDIVPLCEKVERYLSEIDWDKWQQLEDPYNEVDGVAYRQALETARRMIVKGFSKQDISDVTGLTLQEVSDLDISRI